jgi:hypothetical protein
VNQAKTWHGVAQKSAAECLRFEKMDEEVRGGLGRDVPRSKDDAEMRVNVLEQYPGLGMEFTLNDRIANYIPPQPAAGQ